jgi:hypothetical protein
MSNVLGTLCMGATPEKSKAPDGDGSPGASEVAVGSLLRHPDRAATAYTPIF